MPQARGRSTKYLSKPSTQTGVTHRPVRIDCGISVIMGIPVTAHVQLIRIEWTIRRSNPSRFQQVFFLLRAAQQRGKIRPALPLTRKPVSRDMPGKFQAGVRPEASKQVGRVLGQNEFWRRRLVEGLKSLRIEIENRQAAAKIRHFFYI